MKVRTAVVICNWNKKDYLLRCIDSVLNQTRGDFDVYVVDNASDDGSGEAVRDTFGGRVNLIENETNRGGSGGFNAGIAAALRSAREYEFLHLLDNDTKVDGGALGALIDFMLRYPDAAVAGSKLYYMNGQHGTVQEFGAWIDWHNAFIKPNKKNYSEHIHGEITQDMEVDYVPACSLLVRASAVRATGLLDETYFLYWDDMDWAWRMKLKGYKVYAVAQSKVHHAMSITSKKNLLTTYYFWRNRVRFFKKYGAASVVETLLADCFTALFTCEAFKKTNTKAIIHRALIDGLKDIGGRAVFNGDSPELALDAPVAQRPIGADAVKVGHVILDAQETDGAVAYIDNYGNTIAADEALKLKSAYPAAKAEFIETLRRQGLV